jgi:hypothetical protein
MTEESEAIKETVKAAQEIAKASGKAIDAGSKFGDFISKYVAGSLEQAMGIYCIEASETNGVQFHLRFPTIIR